MIVLPAEIIRPSFFQIKVLQMVIMVIFFLWLKIMTKVFDQIWLILKMVKSEDVHLSPRFSTAHFSSTLPPTSTLMYISIYHYHHHSHPHHHHHHYHPHHYHYQDCTIAPVGAFITVIIIFLTIIIISIVITTILTNMEPVGVFWGEKEWWGGRPLLTGRGQHAWMSTPSLWWWWSGRCLWSGCLIWSWWWWWWL